MIFGDQPSRNDVQALSQRLASVERKLDLILHNLGVEPPRPPEMPEVVAEIQRGRKINAIKAYRKATGADLRTAKDAVEAMARDLGMLSNW